MKQVKTFFINAPVEIKKNLLTGSKPTDRIDGVAFAKEIEDRCNELIAKGYNIMDMIPINSGAGKYQKGSRSSNGKGFGYGYGYTSGMMIITNIS